MSVTGAALVQLLIIAVALCAGWGLGRFSERERIARYLGWLPAVAAQIRRGEHRRKR